MSKTCSDGNGYAGPIDKRDHLSLGILPVDRLAASTVAGSEVTALAHEVRNHAVEGGALKVKRLTGATRSLLARAQSPEILSRLGHDISTQRHLNATKVIARASLDVEEDHRIGHDFEVDGCLCNTVQRVTQRRVRKNSMSHT